MTQQQDSSKGSKNRITALFKRFVRPSSLLRRKSSAQSPHTDGTEIEPPIHEPCLSESSHDPALSTALVAAAANESQNEGAETALVSELGSSSSPLLNVHRSVEHASQRRVDGSGFPRTGQGSRSPSTGRRPRSPDVAEFARLRASRGHLFEHFCRDALRRHLQGSDMVQETEIGTADFALLLQGALPSNRFFPHTFSVFSRSTLVPSGLIIFEMKQNMEALQGALKQLHNANAQGGGCAAAVIMTSFHRERSEDNEALSLAHDSFVRAFSDLLPGVSLFVAGVDFNESAWAEQIVGRLEQTSPTRPANVTVGGGNQLIGSANEIGTVAWQRPRSNSRRRTHQHQRSNSGCHIRRQGDVPSHARTQGWVPKHLQNNSSGEHENFVYDQHFKSSSSKSYGEHENVASDQQLKSSSSMIKQAMQMNWAGSAGRSKRRQRSNSRRRAHRQRSPDLMHVNAQTTGLALENTPSSPSRNCVMHHDADSSPSRDSAFTRDPAAQHLGMQQNWNPENALHDAGHVRGSSRSAKRRARKQRSKERRASSMEWRTSAAPQRRPLSTPHFRTDCKSFDITHDMSLSSSTARLCNRPPCIHFHWPQQDGTSCVSCPSAPHCEMCHCEHHLVEMVDNTRGPAAAQVSAGMRVWLLATSDTEAVAFVAISSVDASESVEGRWAYANWGVALDAPEVLVVQPRVSTGMYHIVVRPCQASFYLRRAKGRALQLPEARCQP